MDILISNEQIEVNSLKPFTSHYDKVYFSFNDDFQDNNDFKLTQKNMKKLFNFLDFSWDGEIYWFSNNDKVNVLSCLDDWFKKEENHSDVDDSGISNCFLLKYTPNGLCLIDTQLDMSSNITSFLKELQKNFPTITYENYSDCHLIDNIKLGRNSMHNEFETLYFFYKEHIIDSSFFLNGIDSFNLDDIDHIYYQLLPSDKKIVITGKLDSERDYVLDNLEEAGYTTSDKVTSNSWLWYGEKVGAKKIEAAKEKNITCNSIDDIIEQAYQQYLVNKNNLSNKMKI